MWAWLGSLITGPLIGDLLKAYQTAVASKDTIATAQLSAQVQGLQAAYGLAATRVGQWILAGFAFPVIVYINKVIIWDKVLGAITGGSTDPIGGSVAVWVGLIISFVLGHGIAEKFGR